MLFKGEHYGVTVEMYEEDGILEKWVAYVTSQGVALTLLPFDFSDGYFYNIDVFTYVFNGIKKYNIINSMEKRCYITTQLPEDMDICALVGDIDGQYDERQKPMVMKSKFRKVFTKAFFNACDIIANDNFSDFDRQLLPYYETKADELGIKEANDDEWSDDWDKADNPAKYLIIWKLTADLLSKQGYDYEYMKFIGDLDHHDVGTYDTDIENLKNGFYWRTYIKY